MTLEHPAAIAIRDYKSRASEHEKLETLLLAFEVLLRVDALQLAGVFLQRQECRDDKVRQMLLVRHFHLGDWYALYGALVSILPQYALSDLKHWFVGIERGGSSVLRSLIELRNQAAHLETRTSQEFIRQSLVNAQQLFDACLQSHPQFGTFEATADGRLQFQSTAGVVDSGPFLLSGQLAKADGTIFLYHGCSTKSNQLGYRSLSGAEYWSNELYREVAETLLRKTPLLEPVDSTRPPAILQARMLDITRQSLGRLLSLRRYRADCMVERPQVEAVIDAFLKGDQKLLIIEAPAGAGKSSVACTIARARCDGDACVLLETGDRLGDLRLPDTLAALLRTRGEIGTALERLACCSADERVVIIIDEINANGREEQALLSLFFWIEHMGASNPIRIIVTMRSDAFRAFWGSHEHAVSRDLLRTYELPPLGHYELAKLAEKLPIPKNADRAAILSCRNRLALRIEELVSTSVRRPGLAIRILESTLDLPSGFSANHVYQQLLQCEVLQQRNPDQRPNNLGRVKILRCMARCARACIDRCRPGLRGLQESSAVHGKNGKVPCRALRA